MRRLRRLLARALPGALLALGLLAIGVVFVYGGMQAQKRRSESQDLYAHTLEVLATAQKTLATLQEFEVARRGYIITHDQEDLAPLIGAEQSIDGLVKRLRALTTDNPQQMRRLDDLARLTVELRQGIEQETELIDAGKGVEAVLAFRSHAGDRVITRIRSTMDEFLAAEEKLLIGRRDTTLRSARALGLSLFGLFWVGISLIVLAALGAFTAFRSRMRSEAAEERAAAALELAASERRFRSMLEAAPQIVWASSPGGELRFANARWKAFTGVDATQKAWRDCIHPDDLPGVREAWSRAMATGDVYERELRIRAADGGYRWFLARAVPVYGARGDVEQWLGAGADIHEAKLNLESRELLSQELSHRIKNIFAVVSSLISLSARSDPAQAEFARVLRERIAALGRAHEFVRPHSAESANPLYRTSALSTFLADLFGAYVDEKGPRVRFTGDDFSFGDRLATPFALLFHELGTNAAKYGALSTPDGCVEIACRRHGRQWVLVWRETGGPILAVAPTREGFGASLARISVEGQLGGEIERDWPPTGLVATIRIPLEVVG